ncbi:hypothetical protein A1O7_05577 [Cladophialophora yegresii CBS 114405]|uniref:BTB domain-containing protein n=1 Tax=Cladophialophora yegresii CBS 114405 TaxID=1182544 RepID=W9VQZ2_9EURO|nr:uncharacterized protein A1O7_05577 [Cladophialophora yegresii CBS 114405]EXJ58152.1 hypothetical protein A1O7_05577 [Cladophialophora yegresii CBS 114405]
MAGVHPNAYLDLLKSGDYSDFSITCRGANFRVHRAVETASRKIDLSEDDPETVSRVVLFMYTGDYNERQIPAFLLPDQVEYLSATTQAAADEKAAASSSTPDGPTVFEVLKTNALVYKCADMLGVEDLKVLAAERFMADARTVFSEEGFATISWPRRNQ